MNKDIKYYLDLPWTYIFTYDDKNKVYIASISELKGCMSDGKTIDEALSMIKDALYSYLSVMIENNDEIPEPIKPELYKGKIAYRTTPERHYKIAQKSSIWNKSISKTIDKLVDFALFYIEEENPSIEIDKKEIVNKFNNEFEKYLEKSNISTKSIKDINIESFSWYKKVLGLIEDDNNYRIKINKNYERLIPQKINQNNFLNF